VISRALKLVDRLMWWDGSTAQAGQSHLGRLFHRESLLHVGKVSCILWRNRNSNQQSLRFEVPAVTAAIGMEYNRWQPVGMVAARKGNRPEW
jgi:hypothetical protein